MNILIKRVQMLVVLSVMSEGGSAASPINVTDVRGEKINIANCKIGLGENTCLQFMLDPRFELAINTDTSSVKQQRRRLPKARRFTFSPKTHHDGALPSYEAFENKGFFSASFGVSRAAHNESLEIVDAETSNEHAQVNLMIHFEAIPVIENYMQFFASSHYITAPF